MKQTKQEMFNLVGSAALTVVIYEGIVALVPFWVNSYILQSFSGLIGWLAIACFTGLLLLIASTPAIVILRQQMFKNSVGLVLLGVVIATFVWILSWRLVEWTPLIGRTLSLFISVLGGYLAASHVFNRIKRLHKSG